MDFKGTKCRNGDFKWVRSNMGFQVLTADSYYSICESMGKRGMDEQVANAQLIASAPDLLQSLQELVKILKSSCVLDKTVFIKEMYLIMKEADEVIKKALGNG